MSKPLARPCYHSILLPLIGQHLHNSRLSPLVGKDILVFCDETEKGGESAKGDPTNLRRLYQLAISPEPTYSTVRQKEIIYLSGIGPGTSTGPSNLLSRMFGTTVVGNVIAAYLHVAKHYKARDKVYLFGYSRGAFVVRKVASLIHRIGIVRSKEELLKLWSQHERPVPWNLFNSGARGTMVPIESLVVWDTVGAICPAPNASQLGIDILGIPDDELAPNVQHAFHVVAFHENRSSFRVTLFNPKSAECSRKLKEVWFPGSHPDVGGGGSGKPGFSAINLIWIIGELQSKCSLLLPHEELKYPDLQTLAPSDAYRESPPWKRIVDKCETRLSLLRSSSLVHETVADLRNLANKNLGPSSAPTPYVLSVNDLGRIGWDIKTCMVPYSTLETLKLANARAQEELKQQAARYQTRIASLYVPGTRRALTPSPSQMFIAATDPYPTTPIPPYQAMHTGNGSHPRAESHNDSRSYPNPRHATCVLTPAATAQTERAQVAPDNKTPLSSVPNGLSPDQHTRAPNSTHPRAAAHIASPLRQESPGNATQPVRCSQSPGPQQEAAASALSQTPPPMIQTTAPDINTCSRTKSQPVSCTKVPPGGNKTPHSTSVAVPEHSPSSGATPPTPTGALSGRMSPESMFRCLVERGCPDITSDMNPERYSKGMVAAGGIGDIHRGELRDGTPVAIKMWRIFEYQTKSVKRATREIYNWSKMDHDNVHKLLGVIMLDGRIGMVSKWMDNGDLQAYMRKNQALNRYDLCLQVARGVQYLHNTGIVHGDLKAANILVSAEGAPMLTDFDHSIMLDGTLMFSETTQTGGGTARWMAPELHSDEVPYRNKQTDVYALGMTLLEIVTGMVPYSECRNDMLVIRKIDKKILPEQTEDFTSNERGHRMWDLLVKCWDHKPDARPTADGALQSLINLIEQTAPSAKIRIQ